MKSASGTENGKKIALWVLVFIAVILLLFVVIEADNANNNAVASEPQSSYKYEPAGDGSGRKDELSSTSVNTRRLRQFITTSDSNRVVDTTDLDKTINSIISDNADITFGVSITDLSTDTVHNYGNREAMIAASVTKVITAVYYMHQVELGNRSLNTIMANGYSAQYNIEQMIVLSDNNSWHILNENLGYQQMQDYAHGIGLTSYQYSDNTISSSDTAKLFGDLYERKLVNETNTQLLLSYLERANYREFIVPAVPEYDTVYHKVGFYLLNLNDAAIITNSTEAIVISIYTESTGYLDQNRIASLMQQITIPALETFHLN